ncbi:hypothetical protein ACFLRM_05395 [Acidobacteriota bacterium]
MKLNIKESEFSEHIRLSLLAVIIGVLAGFASIIFKGMIFFFQTQFWNAPSIIISVSSRPWYWTILIPALGGLIIAPIIYFGAKEAKGHGVPEIMESLIFRGGEDPKPGGSRESTGIIHLYRFRRLCWKRGPDRPNQLQHCFLRRSIFPR